MESVTAWAVPPPSSVSFCVSAATGKPWQATQPDRSDKKEPRPLTMPRLLLFRLGLATLAVYPLHSQAEGNSAVIVTGTLVDKRGVPAAAQDVILRPYPSEYALDLHRLGGRQALPEAADRAQSGLDGTFSLSAPEIGPFRLEVHTASPTGESTFTVPLVYRDILPLRTPLHLGPIELPDRLPLTVEVLDSGGRAIDGALVFVSSTAKQTERPLSESYERRERLSVKLEGTATRTASEGLARFLIPATEARVAVHAPGFELRTSTASDRWITFRLDSSSDVHLRVRTPDSQPGHRAVVRTAGAQSIPLGFTNEQGEAAIVRVPDGRTVVEVETASGALAQAVVSNYALSANTSRSSTVEVQLQAAAAIPGWISSTHTGHTVPDAVVWVQSDPGRRTTTDGTGRFELTAPLRSGSLDVSVVANGHISATARVTTELLDAADGASIGLLAAAPFAGVVVDDFQRPVVGANIHFEPTGMGRFVSARQRRSARTTSGPDGSFYIANALYGSAYRLTVGAPDFASVQQELPALRWNAPASPIRVVLSRGRQPWGTVVDVGQAPVEGAQVRLLWPPENPEVGNSHGSREATQPVTSNDRGEFEFPLVAPGLYDLHILHAEHLDLQAETVSVPQGGGYFDLGAFTLRPGSHVHGIVVDPNDNPVKGAEVSMRQRTQGLSRQQRVAITDEDGRFRLGGLTPVPTDVTAVAGGFAPSLVKAVRPGTGEPITIEMAEGASMAGWVLGPDGTPAAGIQVALTLLPADVPRVAQTLLGQDLFRHGRTDADGRFRFDNVVPARWTAEARDETTAAMQEGIEVTHGELREIELRLEVPHRLTVFVTNDLAEPVTNAEVRANPKDRSRRSTFGHTDAGGRAILSVSPGPATVGVEHPDLLNRSREVVIEPGASELHVQLDSGWEITGTVRSIDGVPISRAEVEAIKQLYGEDGGNEVPVLLRRFRRILEPPARALSDAGGGFRLAGLERGRYRLVARLAGHTEGESSNVVEIRGQSVAGVELTLATGASIRGSVVGLGSADLASAEVQAWKGSLFRSARPAIDGSFELSELGPGIWQISATTGGRRSPLQDVTLEPGDSGAFLELRFEPGLRFAGQVLVGGQPAKGAIVTAHSWTGQFRRTRTGHHGRFELEGLQAGTYEVRFWHALGQPLDQQVDLQSDYRDLWIDLQPRTVAATN